MRFKSWNTHITSKGSHVKGELALGFADLPPGLAKKVSQLTLTAHKYLTMQHGLYWDLSTLSKSPVCAYWHYTPLAMSTTVAAAKTRKREPPTYCTTRSSTYLPRYEPPTTAMPVATPWPPIAPKTTPAAMIAFRQRSSQQRHVHRKLCVSISPVIALSCDVLLASEAGRRKWFFLEADIKRKAFAGAYISGGDITTCTSSHFSPPKTSVRRHIARQWKGTKWNIAPVGDEAAASAIVARKDLSPHSAAKTNANVEKNSPRAPVLSQGMWGIFKMYLGQAIPFPQRSEGTSRSLIQIHLKRVILPCKPKSWEPALCGRVQG